MEFTIDELAQRVAMTVRNIREWQTLGLVPPPERRGRVGIYSREHVAIIGRVKHLQAQGLPLDLIRRFIDAGPDAEGDLRRLAAEALNPFADDEPAVLRRADLVHRLGADADTVLVAAGLATPVDAETVSVTDAGLLGVIEELVGAGVTLSRLAETLAELEAQQNVAARLLLERYVDDVWQPIADAGFTDIDWAHLADNVTRAKALAVTLASRVFAKALDQVADGILVAKATEASESLATNRPASTA